MAPNETYRHAFGEEGMMRALLDAQQTTPKRGRPAQVERAEKIHVLKKRQLSWNQITKTLNRELDLNLTREAYRNLYRSHVAELKSREEPQQDRSRAQLEEIFIQMQTPRSEQPRKLMIPKRAKRRGRPRKDALRKEAAYLKREGASWKTVATTLNSKHHEHLSADAYRKLCSLAPPPAGWKIFRLNSVPGKKSS